MNLIPTGFAADDGTRVISAVSESGKTEVSESDMSFRFEENTENSSGYIDYWFHEASDASMNLRIGRTGSRGLSQRLNSYDFSTYEFGSGLYGFNLGGDYTLSDDSAFTMDAIFGTGLNDNSGFTLAVRDTDGNWYRQALFSENIEDEFIINNWYSININSANGFFEDNPEIVGFDDFPTISAVGIFFNHEYDGQSDFSPQNVGVKSFSVSNLQAIPEPSTYALFLGILSMSFAFYLRCRKS